MGYDSILAKDLDAAVAKLVARGVTAHKLVRNTADGIYAGCDRDRDDPQFVAYHRVWVLLPAITSGPSRYPISIAVLMLKEFRSKAGVEVAYKWIAESDGPSAMDSCIVEWFDIAPEPGVGDPGWRRDVRKLARVPKNAKRSTKGGQ